MKKPIYAALDLHSRHSVLGSMEHDGRTQPRMRFATEANILRAQVEWLRRKRRPLYLTMEAGALTRWASGIVRPLVERLIICEARHNRLINSNPTKSDEACIFFKCALILGNPEAGVRSSMKRLLVEPRASVSLIHACPWACEVNSNSYWSDQAGLLPRGQDRPGQLASYKQELSIT